MQCPECGAPYTEIDLFCGECGAVLPTFDSAEPPAEPAAEEILDLMPEGVPHAAQSSSAPAYAPAIRDPRANAAFILGIVSLALLVVSWIPCVGVLGCFQPIVAIVAIVLGAIVKRDIETKGGLEEDRKRAHQGLIMGIVAIALYVVFGLLSAILGVGLGILSEL